MCLENVPLLLEQLRPWMPIWSTFACICKYEVQPNLTPIQIWKEVFFKRVQILREVIACHQDLDSLLAKPSNEPSL
jgi:hypothetical protein